MDRQAEGRMDEHMDRQLSETSVLMYFHLKKTQRIYVILSTWPENKFVASVTYEDMKNAQTDQKYLRYKRKSGLRLRELYFKFPVSIDYRFQQRISNGKYKVQIMR